MRALFLSVVCVAGFVATASACSPSPNRSTASAESPAPPPPVSAATRPAESAEPDAKPTTKPDPRIVRLDALVAKLDNSRLRWSFEWFTDQQPPQWVFVKFTTGIGKWEDVVFDEDELRRRLVKAMDDPAKIAAAHCELYRRGIYIEVAAGEGADPIKATTRPTEPFLYDVGGLVVELTPIGPGIDAGVPYPSFETYHCDARIDPAQFPPLRARWQKQVEVHDYKWPW